MAKTVFYQDLSHLPRINGTNQINWKETVGFDISFTIDNKNGTYKIVSHEAINNKSYLTLSYNNQMITVKANNIKDGCIKTFLRGHRQKRKEFQIGEIINLGAGTFTVLDVKIQVYKKNNKKVFMPFYYLYCHKCKGTFWKSFKEIHYGCSICSGKIVMPGINDIMTTSPDLEPFFSEEDKWMLLYCTSGSSQKIKPICPSCGKQSNKYYKINQLKHSGFSCTCDSTGISYPEKYISCLLDQLNISYIRQATSCDFEFDVDKKRYDFYLPMNNCVIEAHGIQHYEDKGEALNWRSYEDEKNNDKYKYNLIIDNIDHYFVIDCKISSSEYIKKSILSSGILNILNINENDVNWKQCDIYATKNIVKLICDDFMRNPFKIKSLPDKYHISNITLRDYIIRGSKFGWVNYEMYKIVSSGSIINKMRTPDGKTYYFKTKEEIRNYFKSRKEPYSMAEINNIFDSQHDYKGYYFETIKSKQDLLNVLNRNIDEYFIK